MGLRVFEGAVAIITGAASGIGRALSEELARRGASVVLADLQGEEGEAAAASLCASGRAVSAAALDVTDFESVRRLVERVTEEHGRLDFIFNNTGIGVGGEVRDHTMARSGYFARPRSNRGGFSPRRPGSLRG